MRKRIFTLVALSLVLALALGSASFAASKVTITFWHAMGAQLGKTLEALVADFNATHPNIEVKAEYQGNYGALQQKLTGALVAQKPPTVSQVYGNWAAEFITSNALVPIENFVNGPNGMSKLEVEDIFEGLRKASIINGKWYTMPFNKSVYVLVYSKAAFAEAGIEKAPATWQDLLTAANKLTKKNDKGEFIRSGIGLRDNIDIFACFYFASGGEWLDKDGKLAIGGATGQKALQFMVDLLNKYKVAAYMSGYWDADFGAGKTAMYLTSSPGLSYTESSVAGKFEWGVAPIPASEPRFAATPVAGTDLAIYSKSTKAEQDAAWTFVKWMVEPVQTAKWAIGTSYIPVRKSALYLNIMKEFFAKNPKAEQSLKQLNYIKYDPNLAAWNGIRGDISTAVQKAFLAKATVAEALNEAVAVGNKKLGF
ncbi:MAG TPA: ABC transporter substrate-binding protein [Bacillota bacterium]|nr:ABC transporter substrate-binding protein [Bacillota bacterium]HOG53680.1 ABC transporter substrate-binding protein [Bacillota bacterium]